jgi:hypothetical protein
VAGPAITIAVLVNLGGEPASATAEAIAAYRRFLRRSLRGASADEVRRRIETLERG